MVTNNDLYKDVLHVYACDETYIAVDSDQRGVLQSLSDFLTFEIPNANFHPKVKAKMWDGKIRLVCSQTQRVYKGLLHYVVEFCKERDIICKIDDELFADYKKYTDKELEDFVDSLNLIHKPYDFQLESFKKCVRTNRLCLLSPTSSGKSLIMYMLLRWYMVHCDRKLLLTVPSISLTSQLLKEFVEYAPDFDIAEHIHLIVGGEKKVSDKKIYISTYQSIYDQPKKYFSLFDLIIVDEAHTAKAESLKGIFEKSSETKYRFGLTGTLDDVEVNRLVIEGLTGKVHHVTTTKELMDKKIVSQLKINCAVLRYDNDIRKAMQKSTYQSEMKLIKDYAPRTKFIANTVSSISKDDNILILTEHRNHLEALVKQIKETAPDKTVYIVHGDIEAEEREDIRQRVEKESNVVIIATYGVYSTGINIKNLQYVMFASSSKSMIRVLQSIGRGLRKDGKTNSMILIDIVDDFTYVCESFSRRNYILRHFFERIKIYVKEKFDYNIQYINI